MERDLITIVYVMHYCTWDGEHNRKEYQILQTFFDELPSPFILPSLLFPKEGEIPESSTKEHETIIQSSSELNWKVIPNPFLGSLFFILCL